MRLRTRLGCRYGLPHDMRHLYQNDKTKYEVCQICNKKYRWNKGYKGRNDNKKYLEAHVRIFAQKGGATKAIFNKIYRKEKCKIYI